MSDVSDPWAGWMSVEPRTDHDDLPEWLGGLPADDPKGRLGTVGPIQDSLCRVYWGSHGCEHPRGHAGPHECSCCDCPDHAQSHESDGVLCVAKPPYYGESTWFYGEDAESPPAAAQRHERSESQKGTDP